ncbi:MAG: hypothetical protein ACJ8R9_31025 [Steroidobacteraceae bacterium]
MATFFAIKKHVGAISLVDWNAVVDSSPYLERGLDRKGVNPFSKEPILFPGEGKALFRVDGKRVGNIVLEQGQLLTTVSQGQLAWR